MSKILVTGGAGFIGSHLCKYLLKQNNEVMGIDNLFTGSKKNIDDLLKNKNFKFVKHDIIDPLFIEDKINQIYNLACPASPIHYQSNPIRTVKANTSGVINMLGLAREHKARILQASTSEVYGDPLEHPQKETYNGNVNCLSIRSCYDEGKRVAETLCMDYQREHNLDIRIARIFNTYGPNMAKKDGRVMSNFIVQALKNKKVTVYGDGSQTRSFCYVSDMVNGLVKLMDSKYKLPVNLGNPNEMSIEDLALLIISSTSSKSKIIHKKLPEADPVRRKPDITLAKEKLNWEPKVPLVKGLRETVKYFRKII